MPSSLLSLALLCWLLTCLLGGLLFTEPEKAITGHGWQKERKLDPRKEQGKPGNVAEKQHIWNKKDKSCQFHIPSYPFILENEVRSILCMKKFRSSFQWTKQNSLPWPTICDTERITLSLPDTKLLYGKVVSEKEAVVLIQWQWCKYVFNSPRIEWKNREAFFLLGKPKLFFWMGMKKSQKHAYALSAQNQHSLISKRFKNHVHHLYKHMASFEVFI